VAARSIGVNVPGERFLAFVLSGFVVGIGGALYTEFLGTMTPDVFYLSITFTTLAMLVVGGRTSLSGAVIGTIVVSAVTEFLRRLEGGFHVGPVHVAGRIGLTEVGLALVMLTILLWRPSGLTNGREIPSPFRPAAERHPTRVGEMSRETIE
jgi:branched-chain amino acid transport system permease protein